MKILVLATENLLREALWGLPRLLGLIWGAVEAMPEFSLMDSEEAGGPISGSVRESEEPEGINSMA